MPAGGVTKAGDVLGVAPYLADSLADWLYFADRQRVVTGHTESLRRRRAVLPLRSQIPALRWGSERNERSGMDTEDVGSRDFMFGATGVLLMVVVAIAFALFS